MNNKTIYDLKLHEILNLENQAVTVTRVPGGWLYTFYSGGENGFESVSTTFVQYHNEFQEDVK